MILDSLKTRKREAEWMDDPSVDPQQLRRSLRFIRRINSVLGYTRSTLWHLDRFSRGWKQGERITIVDFATGSGDVPQAILKWADRRGFDVRVVGLDLHATTAQLAAAAPGAAVQRLRILRADVLEPPLADGSFDYAITSLFLHHLSDEQVIVVLKQLDRVAKRGVIISDLLRHRRAYAWIKLLTLFSSPMIKHDAAVSVAQAFTRDEALSLRNAAGLSYAFYHHHFGHRFALAGEKANPPFATK